MGKAVSKKVGIPVNGEVLAWARARRLLSVADVAINLKVAPELISEWEDGRSLPNIKQARELSDLYQRPFVEFLGDSIPQIADSNLIPDFRMHRATEEPREEVELLDIQSWAEEQRLNAIDLFEINSVDVPSFPQQLTARLDISPEVMASQARDMLGFSISEQFSLWPNNKDGLVKVLRHKLEEMGVLVLKTSLLSKFKARGMCIAAFPLPVIVYTSEAPKAQAFTVIHEFGHVLLHQSGISGSTSNQTAVNQLKRIEDWCNRFAAAFLVPASALAVLFPKPNEALPSIDDVVLKKLAARFSVSPHAMLIRLIDLEYVDSAYYWGKKRYEFINEENAYKAGGRTEYYGSRYRSSYGDLYTGLVIEAWSSGRITNHNAGEFMGIKNLRHLKDIKDRFV